MSITLRSSLALGIAAACCAALATSLSAGAATAPPELDALFALYDREPDGPAKDRLAAAIDAAAHQKYATVSRLYWHTDLASARNAARAQGRPILHLRMLGRLDEDLSCANSRLFRATLYANQDVSVFLRGNFVLYWSSERPVPRVTIDYGDGRTLERTITGNSAHYVLDEHGHVLDVLPGLYAPAAFRRELEGSLALARRARGTTDDTRARLVADYHQQRVVAARRDWERLSATLQIPAPPLSLPLRGQGDLAAAQLNALTKARIELTDLRQFARGLAPAAVRDDDIEAWAAIGRGLYGAAAPVGASLPVLDRASRALIGRLHDAVPAGLRTTDQQRDAMIASLERLIMADSALNQLRLRPQIGREIVRRRGDLDFEALNAWIYADVFRTPRQDGWLGLLPRDVFTGLPGDGVVTPRARSGRVP